MFKAKPFICILSTLVTVTAVNSAARSAREILETAGTSGGLIVQLGCGDGALAVALHDGGKYTVHALDSVPDKVSQARTHIRKKGLYGTVSVDLYDGKHLPYADNLANVLVVSDPECDVSQAELMRVLAPRGVLLSHAKAPVIKPVPKETDEWTHPAYGAGGNPVTHDKMVGPPGACQWIADPRHARSHEHTPTISTVVSTKGRIFYIIDEGSTKDLRDPPNWHVIARDAYNGCLLWKRSVPQWYPHIVNWGQVPPVLNRRMVALNDRVYVTLGIYAPLSALDAATGELARTYEGTDGTEEILLHQGVLLLSVRKVTDGRIKQRQAYDHLLEQEQSPLFDRESAEPIIKQFRSVEGKAPRDVMALDAETGELLWRKTGAEANLRPKSLCAANGRAFYQNYKSTFCFDVRSGEKIWANSTPVLRCASGDSLVCGGGEKVALVNAKTGKSVWAHPPTLCSVRDVFVIGNSLWVGGFKPWQGRTSGKRGPSWGPYFAVERDLKTGQVLREVAQDPPGHHHRCWDNKATDNFILVGRRGVEFIDVDTGEHRWHSWVRGVCRYGVMPCNGLLYAPPHACGCYISAKLTGFNALAPANPGRLDEAAARILRGPAFAPETNTPASMPEWPTYRCDPGRSGTTPATIPTTLREKWTADLGEVPTAPTVACGKVFVASPDRHTLHAIDVATGKTAWHFTAGARVDSPPTLHRGRALLGCRDGCVYSIRAADGSLAWKLRAAPAVRHISVRGQVESASPVHGSVLVHDGVGYVTAGRSSYLDGGVSLCRFDLSTGDILSETPIYSPDPKTGAQPDQEGPCYMPGIQGDILTSDGANIYLRDVVFNLKGARKPEGNAHLFSVTGFQDQTWAHRTYWMFAKRPSIRTGCSGLDKGSIFGRLLAYDKSTVYGYGRASVDWSNRLLDGTYRLFASKRSDAKPMWTKSVPVEVRALLVAGDVVFAAGVGKREHASKATLLALSTKDGRQLATCPLCSIPTLDGMAAAGGRLYLSCEDGSVLCLASAE